MAPTITVIKNGPFIVTGDVQLKDMAGISYPFAEKLVLCRCGASTKKPFCDGTHGKIGFGAAEQAVAGSADLIESSHKTEPSIATETGV